MLTIRDLRYAVGETSILNGINIQINPGETVGIIGPNGSGKTSLFNCISGFGRATSGSIEFRGQDVTRMPAYQRSMCGIGRVFQNFGIFREMTLLENMIIALEGRQPLLSTLFPWSALHRKNAQKSIEFLKEVKLEAKAKQKASSLSGGQMRLLEIMRTLAFGAELFLLDEPTAGVAPKLKDDVAALILKLQALNKTVLVIEHDLNFIQKFCKRIIVLDSGKVILDGTPESVRANPLLAEIYFGASSASAA